MEILTDPKGELLRDYGEFLKRKGYQVKVINMADMAQGDCFNPFHFSRSEDDDNRMMELKKLTR